MITTLPTPCLCDSRHRNQKGTAHPFRVLVIDDVQDNADSMRMVLELYGFEVRVAYAGSMAIDVAREFCPDVVLCDIGMPIMCGYDVAQELRADPRTARARLVATTGFSSEAVELKCRTAGFERQMLKPIDVDELRDLLASWQGESVAESAA